MTEKNVERKEWNDQKITSLAQSLIPYFKQLCSGLAVYICEEIQYF